MRIIRAGEHIQHIPGYGITVRESGVAVAASGNGLLNNLIAYWPGNEESGDLLDAHTNELDLTDVNTVTSAAGKVYSTARQYTAANSEYHARPADDALLSSGNVDFTVAAWVYSEGWSADRVIVGKAAPREYTLLYNLAEQRFAFRLVSAYWSITQVTAETLDEPGLEQWYFVIGWHDATAGTINIQVDNGTAYSATPAFTPVDGASRFAVGSRAGGGAATVWNGRIGPTMFWKAVLTAAQRTALYNSGNGLTYAAFTS